MEQDWRQHCPGTNAGYMMGKTFYTLQTDSGLFLCHPGIYRAGDVPQEVHYLIGSPPKKATGHSEGGLTKHLFCAWITYSLDDLRELYQYVSPRFAKESERPKHPCTGQFIIGSHGMGAIEGFRRLTKQELNRAKAVAQKSQEAATTASQLTMQLSASYSGVGLAQGALPHIPPQEQKKETERHSPNVHGQKQTASEKIKSWKKKRVDSATSKTGGLFGYTLPKSSPKQEKRR